MQSNAIFTVQCLDGDYLNIMAHFGQKKASLKRGWQIQELILSTCRRGSTFLAHVLQKM